MTCAFLSHLDRTSTHSEYQGESLKDIFTLSEELIDVQWFCFMAISHHLFDVKLHGKRYIINTLGKCLGFDEGNLYLKVAKVKI